MREHPSGMMVCFVGMYSDNTSMKVLHVDTTSTGRWYQHLNGYLVVVVYNIGFTCNDNELSDRFEAWLNDKTIPTYDAFSYHMADCLERYPMKRP